MSYSIGQISKSLIAFATAGLGAAALAAGGADLSVLSLGEWMGALGAGLTSAGAVFGVRNAPTKTTVDSVIQGIPEVVQTAIQAQADVDRLRQATTDALGAIPVFGDAAQAAIDKYILRF